MLTPREMSQLFKATTAMAGTVINGDQLVGLQDVLDLLCLYSYDYPIVTNNGATWTLRFQDAEKEKKR